MVSLKTYLKNPCATLSIPYWKAKTLSIPNYIKIMHDSDFRLEDLDKYDDELYFRLFRKLNNIESTKLNDYVISTALEKDFDTMVSIINKSYSDLHVDILQIKSYTQTPAYNKNLWILVNEKSTGLSMGCGIADYDKEARELILEWIQVLPEYRNKKIGTAIVNELLSRAQTYAKFATVSGKVNNRTRPDILYRKCGFTGNDIWHIMRRKNN